MKRADHFPIRAALVFGAVLPAAAVAAPDGAAIFARCAACHTKTGQGVPGVYPPLNTDFRGLASRASGRRYIVLAVTRGLIGPLTVEGRSFAGVMPAQAGLDDASVAAVLNHVGSRIARAGPAFELFSESEVKGIRAGGAALSAGEVTRLHDPAGGK